MMDAVAVTGVGAVSALGIGADSLRRGLLDGATGIRSCTDAGLGVPAWAPLPDCDLAAATEALAPPLRQAVQRAGHRAGNPLRAALLAAAEAWQQAACPADGARVGVIVAGSNLNQEDAAASWTRHAAGKAVRPSYAAQFMDTDYVAALSEALALRGEGYTVGGASASGGVALAQGRRALLSGDVDAVLVVGVPMMLSGAELAALRAIGAAYGGNDAAGPACRPFDRNAAGFVYGQAGAALVLERRRQSGAAGRPALALLAAATLGMDGNRGTNPSLEGETGVMRRALEQAGLRADAIGLVSAHGTSSVLGDQTEAQALRTVFGDGPWINAPKALLGHCLAAAGVVEAVALVLQMRHGFVHGNPALSQPIDAALRWCGAAAVRQPIAAAMSNSFGFGGVNSCQIFTQPER